MEPNTLTSMDVAGLGFWLALGIVAAAWIWAQVRKQQMKHELTLKLLEKGQNVDEALLEKLLAFDKHSTPLKSRAEKRREESGVGGFIFLVAGVMLAVIGVLGTGSELVPIEGTSRGPGTMPAMMFRDTGPSWPLFAVGVFCFLFGNWILYRARQEYRQDKAEEDSQLKPPQD